MTIPHAKMLATLIRQEVPVAAPVSEFAEIENRIAELILSNRDPALAKSVELLELVQRLQREEYGNATRLHLGMIEVAKLIDAHLNAMKGEKAFIECDLIGEQACSEHGTRPELKEAGKCPNPEWPSVYTVCNACGKPTYNDGSNCVHCGLAVLKEGKGV